MLNLRCFNQNIDYRREEMFEEYIEDKSSRFRMRSLDDYEELRRRNLAKTKTQSQYIRKRLSDNVREHSNGESAYIYFTDIIKENALVIPDNQDNYFTSKGIKKGVVVSGISACYIRYFSAMGIYPVKSMDTIVKSHYYFREDILRLDKYIDECKLLIDNNIETKDDLTRFKGEQIRLLQEMKSKRSKIQNKIRRCSDFEKKDELKVKLFKMNKEIKEQKKIVFYCNDIEKSQNDMQRKVELVEKGSRGNGVEIITERDVAD